jgi:hypothetical protein
MIVPAGVKVDLALGWRAAAYYGARFGHFSTCVPHATLGGRLPAPRRAGRAKTFVSLHVARFK